MSRSTATTAKPLSAEKRKSGVAELVKAGKLSPARARLIEFREPTAREREFAESLSGKIRKAWARRHAHAA